LSDCESLLFINKSEVVVEVVGVDSVYEFSDGGHFVLLFPVSCLIFFKVYYKNTKKAWRLSFI